MAEIGLTPSGRLQWVSEEDNQLASLGRAFEADWREGLFLLAADRADTGGSPTLRYWQDVAEEYLSGLCHISRETEQIRVEPPAPAERNRRLLMAPPMCGGEYLTSDVLLSISEELDQWGEAAAKAAGGLESFLQERAPKWRQVGRVCFHLAENKQDAGRPFAFMASYTAGFGAGGRLKHLPLRRALEQYAGENNRPALINLLSPVEQAASQCDWVRELVDSGRIYQPLAWTPYLAHQFLRSVPDLEQSGLAVRLPDWWKRRPRARVSVTIGDRNKPTLGLESMLDFNVGVAFGGEPLSPEELKELLAGEAGLTLVRGQWVEVDREKLQEAMQHWEAIKRQNREGEISFIEGMRLLAGAPKDLEDDGETDREQPWVDVTAGPAIKETLATLRDPGRAGKASEPDGLRATLRPYQRDGVQWLELLTELGLGACLADDMGLGKTIQVLALLLTRPPKNEQPSLLVVPASLLGNWRDEAERFAPSLRLQFLHPAETSRKQLTRIAAAPREHLAGTDLAVATYSMLTRQSWLAEVDWRLAILDEAQAIKNPSTRQTKAVKKLKAQARIALTGTPVENRLGDLWSLFDFLNPGLLGSAKRFQAFVSRLQSRGDDYGPLRRLAGPYILRRLKTDRSIITDLPEKTETARYCHLSKPQIKLYAQTVKAMESALKAADGIARRGLVLQSLMRLKQICNHPSQLLGDGDYQSAGSGKFVRLTEICEELAERQDKVLIFTQFREIIDPIADHLAGVFGRPGLVLHGGTSVKKRKGIVEQFQEENGPPFFILSLKAGGTGLNLTAASHVIHFDRWWNPAVENQATDRAFRIGQKRNVLVHKFITRGTVEERIDTMINEKRHLAGAVLDGAGEVNLTELPDEELLSLVRLDVSRAEASGELQMDYDWRPYVPVAVRRANALREVQKLRKKGVRIQPIEIQGRKIARSFWGDSWCKHLESFSDYSNRLPRGRTYVRNGSVCHLEIQSGRVKAIVSGSELYNISIKIEKLSGKVWETVKTKCAGQIGSMLELLRGGFSEQVMTIVTDQQRGLFPKPTEIKLDCDCPDWAVMCKHVAAVLYGVGSRLDSEPGLLFVLRGVDPEELIAAEIALPTAAAGGDEVLSEDELGAVFGIDIDMGAEPVEKQAAPKTQTGHARKPRTKRRDAASPSDRPHIRPTGKSVARLRKKLGLSATKFAARLGVTAATVYRWEATNGRLKLQQRTLVALDKASRDGPSAASR